MPGKNKEVNFYGDPTPVTVKNMVAAINEVTLMMERQGGGNRVVTTGISANITEERGLVLKVTVDKI